MSCDKCEAAQNEETNHGVAYYRWKNANIEMTGCDEHLREIFDALTKAQLLDRSVRTLDSP